MADAANENRVTLVVSEGAGSLDYYSQKLAEHLPVRKLHTDLYARTAERFNAPLASRASARAVVEGARLVRVLRRTDGVLHLPNHHFGRYANFLSTPYVITVHDLIRYFDRMNSATPLIHAPNASDRLYVRLDCAGIRKAAAVIAVSETTKRDVVRHLGVSEANVTVVYEGVDHAVFRPVDRRIVDGRYVLFVGSEQPRKNIQTLLKAFARLRGDSRFRDLKLVKSGAPGGPEAPFRERTLSAIAELGLEEDVVFLGRVVGDDLVALYSGAQCLVLPSLYEGFGLPPLEAMACGCPVVVSNAGALVEVVGDAALVTEPTDDEAIAAAVAEILTSAPRRAELRERGIERASRFSWEKTAHETLRVYERVVA